MRRIVQLTARASLVAIAALSPTFLTAAETADAVINGLTVSPAPSWAAYIQVHRPKGFLDLQGEDSSCTGSLVAPQWIITAAHCVADLQPNGGYTVVSPKNVSVQLGRTDDRNKGQKYEVTSIETQNYRLVPLGNDDDVALLRLSKPATTARPLWVLPSPNAAPNGTATKLYGYGFTKPDAQAKAEHQKTGTLRSTKDGDNHLYTDCVAATDGRTCVRDRNASYGGAGDSCGPWVVDVDGAPLLMLVFSGYIRDGSAAWQYGELVSDDDTLPWLRRTTVPDVSPGAIVRDPQTAESWLLDADGFRTRIPDGGTYLCLTATGHSVTNLPGSSISLIPLRTALATCGPRKVLVFGTGDYGSREPRDNLATLLSNAGYPTDVADALPADLSGYGAVYYVSTDPLPDEAVTALVSYAQSGRGLYLTGERPCCEELNISDTTIVNRLVVSVGGIMIGNQGDPFYATGPVPVNTDATGNAATAPHQVTTWTVSAPGGMTNVLGDNVFAYAPNEDGSTTPVAGVWGADDVVGGGRLAIFMDINWLEASYWDATSANQIALNVAFFLSGYSSPPQNIPAPASLTRSLDHNTPLPHATQSAAR